MINENALDIKKEYLKKYKSLNLSINLIEKEIEILLNEEQKKGYRFSENSQIFEKIILNLQSLIKEKGDLLNSIEQGIESLENETEKNILRLKYILGYSWEKISEIMDYSLRQIYNLHIKALLNFPCP